MLDAGIQTRTRGRGTLNDDEAVDRDETCRKEDIFSASSHAAEENAKINAGKSISFFYFYQKLSKIENVRALYSTTQTQRREQQ